MEVRERLGLRSPSPMRQRVCAARGLGATLKSFYERRVRRLAEFEVSENFRRPRDEERLRLRFVQPRKIRAVALD